MLHLKEEIVTEARDHHRHHPYQPAEAIVHYRTTVSQQDLTIRDDPRQDLPGPAPRLPTRNTHLTILILVAELQEEQEENFIKQEEMREQVGVMLHPRDSKLAAGEVIMLAVVVVVVVVVDQQVITVDMVVKSEDVRPLCLFNVFFFLFLGVVVKGERMIWG